MKRRTVANVLCSNQRVHVRLSVGYYPAETAPSDMDHLAPPVQIVVVELGPSVGTAQQWSFSLHHVLELRLCFVCNVGGLLDDLMIRQCFHLIFPLQNVRVSIQVLLVQQFFDDRFVCFPHEQ